MGQIHIYITLWTNPCCKSPNGNLTHFGTFTYEDFFVGCMLWFLCVARPPLRWGSWPMDPRLVTRGSNDLGGAMFKGEHISVHIQACSFIPQAQVRNLAWLVVPPFLFDKRGRKKARSWRPFKFCLRLHQFTKQRSSRKLHQRRALSSLSFVILFAFGFYLSSSKRGRLLRQHDQDLFKF